ncbi:hypothetical protein BurJ1DRAFT_1527 [Burkholderiales bacterium JOSHI_001]|nr:hypothetical protein BurJ1DRAFT_1527 [Burkholderiales bacterium JOSHI_001]
MNPDKNIAAPSGHLAAPAAPASAPPRGLVLAMVETALAAHRAGTLRELLRQHAGAARWLLRRYQPWVNAPAWAGPEAEHELAVVVLQWAVSQLRPDRAPRLDGIEAAAWRQLTAWRPMLAVLCHGGLAPVPDFREHYRRRPDESPVDNLCGLWDVGTSTYYRMLERGKQRLAELLTEWPLSVPHRLALRQVAQQRAFMRLGLAQPEQQATWHRRLVPLRRQHHDPASALWHALQATDTPAFLATLAGHALELAGQAESDALVERLAATDLPAAQRFDLCLARAALFRNRQALEREQAWLEEALRLAQAQDDALLLGRAQGAIGKFHEPRDADRAFACYEASVQHFRDAGAPEGDDEAAGAYLTTLTRLAWLYVLRNDPRARAVLDGAEALAHDRKLAADVLGPLEQTWGEYWRRAGDLERAIASKHRALLIFERLADKRSILVTHLNLISLYWEAKDHARAVECAARIQAAAQQGPVEPAILASTHINLGLVLLDMQQVERAIAEYEAGLNLCLRANLRLQANRAHYNLAEAFYKRFALSLDARDEQRADTHVAAMLGAPASEITPAMLEAARMLKEEVLGAGQTTGAENRLLPQEAAIHTEAMAEVARHRSLLALPVPPEEHARSRLAIAAAYQDMAARELAQAVAHVQAHGLTDRFGDELQRLQAATQRELPREQQLAAAWKQHSADLLDDPRRARLVSHLLREGAINKSGYADLCGVSPATASKHLATFTERGLLHQTGKGPATRYQLQA